MRLTHITLKSIFISVAMCGLAGCQQSNSLSGTVTYNGEPVQTGSVRFDSADGSGPGFGAQVKDGKYSTDKVHVGKHIVYVRGLEEAPPLTREQQLEQRRGANRYNLPVDFIPEDAEGNGQTVDIDPGPNVLNFDIKGPPRSDRPQAGNP